MHALATPPAFVLSQDQTLHFKFVSKRPTPKGAGRTDSTKDSHLCVRENDSRRLSRTGLLDAPIGTRLDTDRTRDSDSTRPYGRGHAKSPHSHDDKPVHLPKSNSPPVIGAEQHILQHPAVLSTANSRGTGAGPRKVLLIALQRVSACPARSPAPLRRRLNPARVRSARPGTDQANSGCAKHERRR